MSLVSPTYSNMRDDERGGARVGLPPRASLITEMRSGIRVARGALSVRPSARPVNSTWRKK